MIKDLYFTYVEPLGSLLLVWAQSEKKNSEILEKNIQSIAQAIEYQIVRSPTEQLSIGKLCLIKVKSTEIYRVKIVSLSNIDRNLVTVYLVDYGNTFEVLMENIRLLEPIPPIHSQIHFIAQMPPLASSFYLAEVAPLGSNIWQPAIVDTVKNTLCSKAFKCNIVEVGAIKNLIQIYVSTEPVTLFSSVLVCKRLAQNIDLQHQATLIQTLLAQANVAPTLYPQPPPVLSAPMVAPVYEPMKLNPAPMVRRQTPAITVSQYTSIKLQSGSRHAIYISHVEDGVFSFAVQLKVDADEILPNFMLEINEGFIAEPISGLLMPGSLCLARYTGDKAICRAVVTDIVEDKVKVYYVDFGNSEELPPSEVFAIPTKLITQKVMASKFALADTKDDPEWKLKVVKDYFQDFVGEKEFLMDVKPNETSSFMQYCNLYYAGRNVKDILKAEMDKIIPFNYKDLPKPILGSKDKVIVTFVESPTRFFVQFERYQNDLQTVMSCIENFCNSPKGQSGMFSADDLRPNLPCCAFYDVDNKWYRAQILESANPAAIVVRYVDYGNQETVNLVNLRRIEKKLVTEFCVQAIECCLDGYESTSVEDVNVANYLEELILEQPITMKVVGNLSSKVLIVDLVDSQGNNISQLLKNQNVPEIKTEPIASVNGTDEWNEQSENPEPNDWTSPTKDQKAPSNFRNNFTQQNHDYRASKPHQNTYQNDSFGSFKRQPGKMMARSDINWRQTNTSENTHVAKDSWRNKDSNDYSSRSFSGNKFNEKSNQDDNNLKRPPRDFSENREGGFKKDFSNNREGSFKKDFGSDRNSGFNNRDFNNDREGGLKKRDFSKDRDGGFKKRDFSKDRDGGFKKRDFSDDRDGGFKKRDFSDDRGEGGFKKRDFSDDRGEGGFKSRDFNSDRESGFKSRDFNSDREGGFKSRDFNSDKEGGFKNKDFGDGGSSYKSRDYSSNKDSGWKSRDNQSDKGDRNFRGGDHQSKSNNYNSNSRSWGDAGNTATNKSDDWNKSSQGSEKKFDSGRTVNKKFDSDRNQGDSYGGGSWKNRDFSSERSFKPKKTPGFPSGEQYTRVAWEIDSVHEVQIPWFIDPSKFYVQLLNTHEEFRKMMTSMQSEYVKRENSDISSMKVGDCIVAKFSEDNVIYRAQVKEVSFTGTNVEFVDFGNCAMVDSKGVWNVSNEHCQLPCQAVLCSLNGVSPIDESKGWGSDVSKIIKFFEGDKYSCSVISYDEESGSYSVDLFNTVDNVDVADQLVEEGVGYKLLIANLQSEDPLDCSLLVNQTIRVNICCVISRSQFFIHIDKEKIDALQESVKLAVEYYGEVLPILPEEKVIVGEYCLGMSEEVWYRARITDLSGTAGIVVTFIDFGDTTEIPQDQLIAIPDDLLVTPGQAVECSLPESADVDENKLFLVMEQESPTVIVHIQSVDDNGKLSVTLFDEEGKDLFGKSEETIDPLCKLPVAKYLETVTIAHAENSESDKGSFLSLHYVSHANAFDKFLDVLFSYEEDDAEPFEATVNAICVAKSPADEQWHRGRVLSIEPEITVEYLDYGNSEIVPADNLRKIKPELLKTPLFAIFPVYLPVLNFSAADLLEMYQESELFAKFKNFDSKLYVNLTTFEGVDVCDELINLGKAEALAQSLFGQPTSSLSKWQAEGCVSVVLTYASNPNLFYLQLISETDTIRQFQDSLQNDVSKMMPLIGTSHQYFAAKYVVDDTWYRAELISDDTVRFIDFGNEDSCDLMKKLPLKYSEAEPYAIACSLPIVPVDSSEWSEEAINKFETLLTDVEELSGEILSVVDNVATVKLTIGGKSVCDTLIEENLASLKPVIAPISHINSLTDFYIQENISACDAMIKSLSDTESWKTPETVEIGSLLAAKFDEDERFYRALVTNIMDDVKKVLFIDYGNSATTSEFKELPDNVKAIKPLALKCSLNIPDSLIAPETVDKFKELSNLGETEFTVKFLEKAANVSKVDLLLDEQNVVQTLMTVNEENLEPIGKMSQVNSPLDFYVQYVRDGDVLDDIADALVSANEFESVENVVEGLLVAAKYEDGSYYRAKVLADTSAVFFIDFGNVSSLEDPRVLPDSIKYIPPIAKHCSVQLPENSIEFPESAGAILDEITGGLELKIKFLNFDDPRLAKIELNGTDVLDLLSQVSNAEQPGSSDQSIPCTISHINSPTNFYVQRDVNLDSLDELSELLAGDLEDLEEVSIGDIVAAKSNDDEMWYRAEILSEDEEGHSVFFIDYGNTDVVTEFKKLPEEISEIPPLAEKYGFKAPDFLGSWPDSATAKFAVMIEKAGYKCELIFKQDTDEFVDLMLNQLGVSDELAKQVLAESSKSASKGIEEPEITIKTEKEDAVQQMTECSPDPTEIGESFDEPTFGIALTSENTQCEENESNLELSTIQEASEEPSFGIALEADVDGDIYIEEFEPTSNEIICISSPEERTLKANADPFTNAEENVGETETDVEESASGTQVDLEEARPEPEADAVANVEEIGVKTEPSTEEISSKSTADQTINLEETTSTVESCKLDEKDTIQNFSPIKVKSEPPDCLEEHSNSTNPEEINTEPKCTDLESTSEPIENPKVPCYDDDLDCDRLMISDECKYYNAEVEMNQSSPKTLDKSSLQIEEAGDESEFVENSSTPKSIEFLGINVKEELEFDSPGANSFPSSGIIELSRSESSFNDSAECDLEENLKPVIPSIFESTKCDEEESSKLAVPSVRNSSKTSLNSSREDKVVPGCISRSLLPEPVLEVNPVPVTPEKSTENSVEIIDLAEDSPISESKSESVSITDSSVNNAGTNQDSTSLEKPPQNIKIPISEKIVVASVSGTETEL